MPELPIDSTAAAVPLPVSPADEHAMRLALDAGWHTARAGRIPRKLYANASSPWEGVITHIPGE